MRTRLLLLFAFAAATIFTNVAFAGNIAHGVEVVVIDAGHGGKFPGAHYGGVYEKDLTLKVALKLGKLVEEGMPGVKVVYTRSTDKTLGADLAADLQARADIANKAGGDLFISIHANAAPRATGVRGVETLIMGESSKEQRYNENALFENNREDLIDMSDERTAAIVRAYIQNLQFTYGEYSMAFARCIQNSYLKAGRHSRGIKPQLLRVLYATDMPGVLTEIGFMSNQQELAYMKSDKGQNEIARSLYQAIRNYSAYVLGTRMAEEEQAASAKVAVAGEKATSAKPGAAEQAPASAAGTAPEKKPAEGKAAAGKPGAEKPAAKPAEKTVTKPAEGKAAAPAPSETPEKPAAKPAVQPLRYTIQVMASASSVPVSSAQFRAYRGKVKEYKAEGRFPYKYGVGEYDTREAAQRKLAEVRKVFPGAFVAACRGTQIVK
ncbi:N-acetylmuramoyl-L-alanine amidase [Alistipes sp.]|uniref:N-acetylmuramoyl-L-alanine amidase n=1 Tax=Alistipes sp. TaxID=1872444 RepID=UPI003AF01F3D